MPVEYISYIVTPEDNKSQRHYSRDCCKTTLCGYVYGINRQTWFSSITPTSLPECAICLLVRQRRQTSLLKDRHW